VSPQFLVVQVQGHLTPGVLALERPLATLHRSLLHVHHVLHVEAPVDAGRQGQDDAAALLLLSLFERLHALVIVRAHGH